MKDLEAAVCAAVVADFYVSGKPEGAVRLAGRQALPDQVVELMLTLGSARVCAALMENKSLHSYHRAAAARETIEVYETDQSSVYYARAQDVLTQCADAVAPPRPGEATRPVQLGR